MSEPQGMLGQKVLTLGDVRTKCLACPNISACSGSDLKGSAGEMERWRDGEMERWRDGEMERWRDGDLER